MRKIIKTLVMLAAAGLALALGHAILQLPQAAVSVPAQVAGNMGQSGVEHPVTAVLLNFRGYDTLLEVAVLLLAFFGVLALSQTQSVCPAEPAHALLQALARLLAPLMVLVAGYLLWIGAYAPGGAFQAGAVLAAAGVMLRLAGLLPAWAQPDRLLRTGLVAGLLVFVVVALIALGQGALLQYPSSSAGTLILLIETGLTLSIGLTLSGLYLCSMETRA